MNEALRTKFALDRTAFGLWVTSEGSAITEVAALLGLDWICIDMEHGYIDFKSIAGHLAAARGSDLTVLVRPPSQELEPAKRALDLGAHGLIIPLVDTAEELRAVQRNVFYPPKGRRGIGGERSASWGLDMTNYVERANDEILVIPMIETQDAYDNLDEILAVEGTEAVFLGPGDLSASRGAVGEWEGPGVTELNLDIRERASNRGVASGIVATSTDDLLQRREQGFNMVSIGSDIGLMIRQIKQMAGELGKETAGHRWF